MSLLDDDAMAGAFPSSETTGKALWVTTGDYCDGLWVVGEDKLSRNKRQMKQEAQGRTKSKREGF